MICTIAMADNAAARSYDGKRRRDVDLRQAVLRATHHAGRWCPGATGFRCGAPDGSLQRQAAPIASIRSVCVKTSLKLQDMMTGLAMKEQEEEHGCSMGFGAQLRSWT